MDKKKDTCKILIVDDDIGNVMEGIRMAENIGLEGIGVTSGKKAIDIIRNDWNNLLAVLTDMKMEEDGAGEKVVRECIKTQIPVAVVTLKHHGGYKQAVAILLPAPELFVKDDCESIKLEEVSVINIDGKNEVVWKRALIELGSIDTLKEILKRRRLIKFKKGMV